MKVWEFCNKIMDMKNVLAESVGMKKVSFDWKNAKDTGDCEHLECCDCLFYGDDTKCNESELKKVLNMDIEIQQQVSEMRQACAYSCSNKDGKPFEERGYRDSGMSTMRS